MKTQKIDFLIINYNKKHKLCYFLKELNVKMGIAIINVDDCCSSFEIVNKKTFWREMVQNQLI